MAVVTSMYYCYKYDILTGATKWASDTIKCALFTASTYTGHETDTSYSTTGTESTGTGYTAGGAAVGTCTTSAATVATNLCKITGNFGGGAAGTTIWTITDTLSAASAKLYSSTASRLICNIDFGATQTASGGGTFTITWDATNGVFNLA